MPVKDYSTTPASNATQPGINMATGAAPSTVHPGARQIMADIATARTGTTALEYTVKGDGATDDAAAFALVKTAVDATTEQVITNQKYAPTLTLPKAVYVIGTDVTLPANVVMHGRTTGAGKLLIPIGYQQRYKGLASAGGVKMTGNYLTRLDGCFGPLTVNGGGVGFGSFWNHTSHVNGDITLDASNFSINFDRFNQIKTVSTGIAISGTGAGVVESHANIFDHCDVTYGGIHNTCSVQQTNYVQFGYYDALASADIVGPFHIYGLNGDASHPPLIDRRHHLLATTDQIEKNRADFFRMGTANLATGGNWDYLVAGYPASLSTFGGTATIQTDATEPSGAGKRAQLVCTSTFQGFAITIPACASGKFGLTVWYKGNDFEAADVNRSTGGGTTSNYDGSFVAANVDGWKEYKLSGIASTNSITVIHLYVNAGTVASKTTSIGGFFAGAEKATPLPMAINQPAKRIDSATSIYGHMTQHGTASFAVASGTFVDVTVTFPNAYATNPFVQVGINSATATASASFQGGTLTTATIRVFGAVGVNGGVTYIAIGDAA